MTHKGLALENNLKDEMNEIIDKGLIRSVFQPIVSLYDGSIFGHEALSRGPDHSFFKNPERLFSYAIEFNKIWDLELLCRTKSLEALHKYYQNNHSQLKAKLFLNVNPNIIHDQKFKKGFTKKYLSKFSFQPDSIIFEITEKGALTNIDDFKKTVQNYKDQNYSIALDDAGAGLSELNMITDIRPHYIKLDMNLIRNIDTDPVKQALIKSMVEFAKRSDTYLVAEGIESSKELETLIKFGVQYGQGYFIQRPDSEILPIRPEIKNFIKHVNQRKNYELIDKVSNTEINRITTRQKTLSKEVEIHKVEEMMNENLEIPGFCITENGEVIGVVTRSYLYAYLGSQYGYSLYSHKPISEIMSTEFLQVNHHDPIDKVAKLAMNRKSDKLYDFVSVIQDNKYFGIVTVKDLLEQTIEIEINHAKHLNPISGLPGNLMIEQHIEKRLQSNDQFTLLYFDIDHFKAYNDTYGFEQGDLVIKRLALILQETIPNDEFIGHIGGDDFIATLPPNKATQLGNKILDRFDRSINDFYEKEALENGYIVAKNRNNIVEKVPLLSISIGGVENSNYLNVYEISKKASQMKKRCKRYVGSICLIQ